MQKVMKTALAAICICLMVASCNMTADLEDLKIDQPNIEETASDNDGAGSGGKINPPPPPPKVAS